MDLVRPSQALAGVSGQAVTVVGRHFEATRELSCKFGLNATHQGVFMSSTMVACMVPTRGSGTASVSVSNDGTTFEASGMNLEFVGAGGVLSVSPSYGPMAGGSQVTVKGAQMGTLNGTVQCKFGVHAVWARVTEQNNVVCSVPKTDLAGDVQVILVHMGTTVPGSVVYRYLADAEVWSILPSVGQMMGQTPVSVIGTGFVGGGLQCRFGTQVVAGAGVHWHSSTLVLCTSPAAREDGRVAVEISVSGGIGFTTDGTQFMYELGARTEGVRPSVVKSETALQQVTVIGHNFRQVARLSCVFGLNSSVPALYVSSTTVVCEVPMRGPGVVKVSVSNNGIDRGSMQTWLEYVAPVTGGALRLNPSSGPVEGGTRVQVVEASASEATEMGCKFGDRHVNAERGPDGGLFCQSPYQSASGVVTFQMVLGAARMDAGEVLQFVYFAASAVQRLSPERGALSGGTLVSVQGTGFAGDAVQCRFGAQSVVGKGVSLVSSTLVHCAAPASNSLGHVSVEVSMNGGADFTSSGKKFVYEQGATATSLRPSVGWSGSSSQVVTVAGRHFEGTGELRCQIGDVQTMLAMYLSSSTVVCTLPAWGAGTVSVSVSNNGVDYDTGVRFEYLSVPKVISVTPSMGPTTGGGLVTMHGAGLGQGASSAKCKFGQSETRARVVNASTMTCAVPGAASVGIVVAGLSGLSDNSQYEYYDAPTIQSIQPSYGAIGKSSLVTLVGTGFGGVGLECRFGSESIRGHGVRLVSASMMVCESPLSMVAASVAVEVSLNGGADFTSSRREFTFTQAATLEGLSPSSGVSGTDGQVVKVAGRHFEKDGDLSCSFGRTSPVRAVFLTSSLISCKSMVIRPGSVAVSVTQHGIEASGAGVTFKVVPEYDGWTLNPSQGPASGGNMVTIVGSLASGESTSGECVFGSVHVLGEVLNTSSLRCVVPAGVEGRVVRVAIKIAGQSAHSSTERAYTYMARVQIGSAWPTRGSNLGGTLVSVTGSGFDLQVGLMCRFGLTTVRGSRLKVMTSSLVTCLSPAADSLGSVSLEVSEGTGSEVSSGFEFVFEASASVDGVWPSSSAQRGTGQVVTVSGSHFVESSALSCRFGMVGAVRGKYLSSSLVVCSAPGRGSGVVNVVVSNNGVDSCKGSAQFTYTPEASVLSVLPSRGPLSGGTTVTLEGSLTAGANTTLYCMFGMTSAIARRLPGGRAACIAPAFPKSGAVALRLQTNSNRGSATRAVQFEYFQQPGVHTVSPSRGSGNGGTLIQITGVGFLSDGGMCRFGEAPNATVGRVVSSTHISCVTPASSSSGLVSVEVSFNGGADFTADGHRFVYEEQAVVEAVVPSTGRSGQSGQEVTVIGRHFIQGNALSCLFGRESRVAGLHVSSSTVVCAVPGQIVGTVTVSVSNNGVDTGVSGKPFAMGVQRSMVSLTPSRGPVEGGSVVMIEVAGGMSPGEEKVTCVFGGKRVQGQVVEETGVECVATGGTGAGKVQVAVEGVSGLTGVLDFEYYFAPVINRLVPSRGSLGGGSMVTLHGTGFSGELRCRFGSGVAGEGKGRYVSSSMVSCRSPGVAEAGSVIVEVSINDGADYGGEGKEYVYEMGATVEAVIPSRGQTGASGQFVTVVGRHFVKSADLRYACVVGLL